MARFRTVLLASACLAALAAGCDEPLMRPLDGEVREDAGIPSCPGDSDGDGVLDDDEGDDDPDGDSRPSSEDDDSDGDGAPDAIEAGDGDCATPPRDTDGDGIPDLLDRDANGDFVDDATQHASDRDMDGTIDALDLDTDGDTILNADERGEGPSARDRDADGTPDVLDLESDSDGLPDHDEAGDADPATPPVHCASEVGPDGLVSSDGAADASDLDRDDDGLADGEELAWGTDPCGADTDGDGHGDLIEVAYQQLRCPDRMRGVDCDCAANDACGIPPTLLAFVLPFGASATRDLEVTVAIRRADVFFALDTTASMGGTLANIQTTISSPGTGIVDRVAETIPDAWFGVGQVEDFPFSSYGGAGDTPFRLAREITADPGAISMMLHGGGDGPEAHVEALARIVTGEGESWTWSGMTHEIPDLEGDCVAGRWGAPCFREGALPVIVLFTDVCSHEGPPDDDPTACAGYTGITPGPTTWDEMIAILENRNVTFVGVNAANAISCATSPGAGGTSPCWFLRSVATELGSVDLEGDPLVFDLPNTSGTAPFVDTITSAIETVATRVPRDVSARLTTPSGPIPIDGRRLIDSVGPACTTEPTCWVEPTGTAHDAAVASYDGSTFFDVVPGTRLMFRLAVQNDEVEGGVTAGVAGATVEFRADHAEILVSYDMLVAVPADDGIDR